MLPRARPCNGVSKFPPVRFASLMAQDGGEGRGMEMGEGRAGEAAVGFAEDLLVSERLALGLDCDEVLNPRGDRVRRRLFFPLHLRDDTAISVSIPFLPGALFFLFHFVVIFSIH